MSRSRRTIETNNYLELLIQELRKGSRANPINIKQFIKYALQTITKQNYYDLIKTAINCKCAGEIVKSLLANVQQDKSILTDIFNNELKKGLDANLEYIEILLNSGVIIINDGYIPSNNSLQIALRNKSSANIIQLILEKGATVDNSQKGNSSINHALYWGCDFATIQILFQYGALVTNQKQVREITENSLHLAIEHDHSLETIKILLQNNALLVTDTENPYCTTLSIVLRKNSDLNILELFSSFSRNFVEDSDRTGKYCLINQLFEIYQANLGYNPKVNDILKFLLLSGARPCNDIDNNSLDIALKYNAFHDIMTMLQTYGAKTTQSFMPKEQCTIEADLAKDKHYEEEYIAQHQKSNEKSPTTDEELKENTSYDIDTHSDSSYLDFRYRINIQQTLYQKAHSI
ncbi:hypothetical protein OAP83_00995 [Rickettsiales bacterium]|nr:hypothetical protein [Rickettsiales bacterium]